MSDIFISYASEDRERTALLAKALQDMGWSVWWDRSIPTGKTFVEVIKAELEAAKCAVVVWSRHSVVRVGSASRRGRAAPPASIRASSHNRISIEP